MTMDSGGRAKIGTDADAAGTTTIFARLRQIVDTYLADGTIGLAAIVDLIDDATNGLAAIKAEVEGLAGAAMRGTDGAALAAAWTAALATILGNFSAARIGYLDQLDFNLQEAITLQATLVKQDIIDGIVDNILLDTQIRVIQSGAQAIVADATEWLRIDSGTNGAEILSIVIKGLIGHDWTLDIYVPAEDAVNAPAADDKRDTIPYAAVDAEGGLLKPFAIPFNCYLQFTNDGGDDQIDQVTVTYRSRGALTLTWGP